MKQPFNPSVASLTRERFGASLKKVLDVARTRLLVTAAIFIFGVLIIAGRLIELTLIHQAQEPSLTEQHLSHGLQTGRSDIVDRHGQILATTIVTSSLYANAKNMINKIEAAQKLLTVLPNLKYEEIIHRLSSNKSFIWLARHLTPIQQKKILRLGIPGLSFMRDQRRIYPHGRLASHVLGFTDIDNRGISGIEKGMDHVLSSQIDPLRLSLDLRLQHIVRDELIKGIKEFEAVSGCGAIMDNETGEILAMVSLPDFDPNHPMSATDDERFNKVTLGIYEVGSIMKVANTIIGLESGAVNLGTKFDASHPLKVGRFSITDFRGKNRWLNVAEIMVYSSNIGAAKIALSVGLEKQQQYMEKLGYLTPPKFELPEVGAPLVPKKWTKASAITISYGYGLSISPLQVMLGIGAIVSQKQKPTLLYQENKVKGEQVISIENNQRAFQLMRYVTLKGSGRKANIFGFYIGLKTGTSNLRVGRHYQKEKVMTNVVAVLGEKKKRSQCKPRYTFYAMLLDPKRQKKTYNFNNAGWNVVPIIGKIIARTAPILGFLLFKEEPEPLDPFLKTINFQ